MDKPICKNLEILLKKTGELENAVKFLENIPEDSSTVYIESQFDKENSEWKVCLTSYEDFDSNELSDTILVPLDKLDFSEKIKFTQLLFDYISHDKEKEIWYLDYSDESSGYSDNKQKLLFFMKDASSK